MEQSDNLVGIDPVISARFQRNQTQMRPAGGEVAMDLSLIHLTAHEGVDRIFSHPYDKPRDLSPE